jgi:hypothetical protein
MVLFHKSSCPLRNLSFYSSIWSGIKPISIYGKNPAFWFKDSLPFTNRTRRFGRVQSRNLLTTRSKELPSKERFSASPWKKSISSHKFSASCFAFSSRLAERSIPVTSCPISAKRRARKPAPVQTFSIFKRSLGGREFSNICFQIQRSSSSKPFTPFVYVEDLIF